MKWRLIADVVLVTHLAFVVFTVLGAMLVWRWRRLALVHIPIVVYGVALEVVGFRCPLTPLEQALRRRAGGAGYDGGFVEHYIVPVLYPGEWTATVRISVSLVLIVANAIVYWAIRPSRRTSGAVEPTYAAQVRIQVTPSVRGDRIAS